MKKQRGRDIRFALCMTDSEPDLELRKIYQVLPDESAAKENLVRVIDESGEDYLSPASSFVFIELPQEAERAFLRTS